MKPAKLLFALAVACLAWSCAKDMADLAPDSSYAADGAADCTAIVTIKKSSSDTVFFQLNESTTLFPYAWQDKYIKVQRLYCRLHMDAATVGTFGRRTDVLWAEPLEEGLFTYEAAAGADGLDLIWDWMTCVEDGFLTLHYSTWWGRNAVQHRFAVVAGANPDDPYELRLVQDARGDARDEQGDALICFDINALPSTGDEYKTLTLKWTDCAGKPSEKKFSFKSRQ